MRVHQPRKILLGFIIFFSQFGFALLINSMREANEFMKTARGVRADVIAHPLGGRIIRYELANETVTLPLERLVSPRQMREVGDHIDIACRPERPKELRWLAKVYLVRG